MSGSHLQQLAASDAGRSRSSFPVGLLPLRDAASDPVDQLKIRLFKRSIAEFLCSQREFSEASVELVNRIVCPHEIVEHGFQRPRLHVAPLASLGKSRFA
jgi:hypothetical protein